MLELDDLFDNVNIVDAANKHIEIEVKFKIKPRYKLISQFNRLLTHMQKNYPETIEKSIVTSYGDIRHIVTDIHDIYENKVIIATERKTRLKDYYKYSNDYGFVISISEEIPVQVNIQKLVTTNVRQRDRHSFKLNDLYQLDLTKVYKTGEREAQGKMQADEYEIELEYLGDYKKLDLEKLEDRILYIYTVLNESEFFITENQRTQLINEFNNIFKVPSQNTINKNITVKARNIQYRDLVFGGIVGNKQTGYAISHKADGKDHYLITNKVGVWLVSSTGLNLIVPYKGKLKGTQELNIFKCEVVDFLTINNVIYDYYVLIYDCLVYKNENLMDLDLDERTWPIAQIIIHLDPLNKDNMYRFVEKKHTELTRENFFIIINQMYDEQAKLEYPQDGFIFTPTGKYNYHSDKLPLYKRQLLFYPDVCKWKPPPRITIDFRFLNNQLWVYNSYTRKEEPFTGSYIHPLSAIDEAFDNPEYQGKIVESEYDLVCKVLRPVKIRHDKDGPNQLDIAEANWNDLHDYIAEEDLSGETLTLVKKYHNQIKNILYNLPTQYEPLNIQLKPNYTLLDIGGGRGGDLGKWEKSKVGKVITVEPNNDNLNELYKRLQTSNVDVVAINTVGEDTKQITQIVKQSVGQVDVVSLMLSLSFFWASEAHLDALVQTIAANLKLNGYVVFLTIDGDVLGPTTQHFNDASFTYYGDNGKGYGQFVRTKITGIVGTQWEFLVHLPDLTSKLEKYGIVLRDSRPATDEMLMSIPQQYYTSLFTYGYYQKIKEVPVKISSKKLPVIVYPKLDLVPLKNDEVISITGLIPNMVSIGCEDLLDAILKGFSEEYQNDHDPNIKIAFRQELSAALEKDWETFNHGYFKKKLLNQISEMLKGIEQTVDYTLLGLQYLIQFDDLYPVLPYIAYYIDVDIFIFDQDLKLKYTTFSCYRIKYDYILIIDDRELIGQKEAEGIRTLFDYDELYKLKLQMPAEEQLSMDVKTLFGPTMPNLTDIISTEDMTYKYIENAYFNIDIYTNALLKNISKVYKLPNPKSTAYEKLNKQVLDLFKGKELKTFLDQFKKIPLNTTRVEERIRTITDIIKDVNFATQNMKVLDIGAGKGEIIQAVKKYYNLPSKNVYAIDQKLPKIKDITTLTYQDGKIPLPDKSIDLILMFVVLHHIPVEPRLAILKEVERILVPGGLVIIREHDDDKDPNFYKFIDLIHQFWYISENEKEDPLFLMSRDETTNLMKDIHLSSIHYTNKPNPQHIYHEAFQSYYDDFPYKKYSMNLADVDKRFNNLKKYKFETVIMPYKIRNVPGDWYNNPKVRYNNLLIVNKETDYLNYNLIAEYWVDECQMRARRYDQSLTPLEYWQQNKEYVKQQALKLYNKIDAYTLRETIYKLAGEVTSFRPTLMVGFIKMFKAKRILDPSSGWFNRGIGALAMNVESYTAVDPNSCLHPKYEEMIKHFPSTTKVTIIQAPFEEAILPKGTYDLVITSFPYFNLEVYSDEPTQSITNRDLSTWFDDFLIFSMNKCWEVLEKSGHMVIIVNDIKDQANYVKLMVDVFTEIHDDCKYLGVISYTELVNNQPKNPQPCWIFQKNK